MITKELPGLAFGQNRVDNDCLAAFFLDSIDRIRRCGNFRSLEYNTVYNDNIIMKYTVTQTGLKKYVHK